MKPATPLRTLAGYILLAIVVGIALGLALLPGPANAQLETRAIGGERGCWHVTSTAGEVSTHTRMDTAIAAAANASFGLQERVALTFPCVIDMGWGDATRPPPGDLIGTAVTTFAADADAGIEPFTRVRACYSLDGGETYPLCGDWTLDAPISPLLLPEVATIRLERLPAPEATQ